MSPLRPPPWKAALPDVRIAVISPFLDRRHGTERCVIEQLENISGDWRPEVHIYSQRIEDLRGVTPYRNGAGSAPQPSLQWHRVPAIPGPHLLQYLWWFYANQACRWRDRHFRNLKYDLIYSPGINSPDADAIAVHIVFRDFYFRVRSQLKFRGSPLRNWPLLLHRRLYYRLIMAFENKMYRRPDVSLAAVSGLVSEQLGKYFGRTDVRIIRNGVDSQALSPHLRSSARESSRRQHGFSEADFVVLLIGNDWKKKGLDVLLQALASNRAWPIKLAIVGSDDRRLYQGVIEKLGLGGKVFFLNPSPDVLQFYALADCYAGPSLEDAFGLPVLEAMACGLPVIASAQSGVSELLNDGANGLILRDAGNAAELASLLERLCADADLRRKLGEAARLTAVEASWQANAQAVWEWLGEVLKKKAARSRD